MSALLCCLLVVLLSAAFFKNGFVHHLNCRDLGILSLYHSGDFLLGDTLEMLAIYLHKDSEWRILQWKYSK